MIQRQLKFNADYNFQQSIQKQEMSKYSSPQKSPSKQNLHHPNEYKKIVQKYTISYCQKQFLGRSLYGQVRLGYETNGQKVRAFRINSLPITEQSNANLQLQKYYSELSQCACLVYQSVQSQSNRYTVMEYFPRTFKTQLNYFRKLTKNMQPYIQKFLQTYAKLYYYRITHGNLAIDNIGITFEGKVKLMDFRALDKLSFEEGAMKDYRDFRNMMCFILERDKTFPNKLEVLDDPEGNWVKLFSVWHVVNIYQYMYREKKEPFQNIAVLLCKLEGTIYSDLEEEQVQQTFENPCQIPKESTYSFLRIALRLLILSSLKKVTKENKKVPKQIAQLERILHPVESHNVSFYNSLLWGCINDPAYYNIHQTQRLTLILCLLPSINHQYFYMQILKQFQPNKEQASKFSMYSDTLIRNYASEMKNHLITL